jgi:prophage maintenance system killer protein
VLKRYIKDGYAVNIKRMERELKGLKKLKSVVGALGAAVKLPGSIGMEVELINLISGYSGSLEILQDYDDMALKSTGKLTPTYELKFEEALSVVEMAKKEYKKGSAFFGTGPMSKLKSIIGAINQTFDGKDLYPTVEEKASHLLYFAVKDHPFTDGNKRLAAILFLHYMSKNGMLYLNKGEKRVSDGALAALTLLAAVSSPKEKEIMINVITNVIRTGG